MGVKTPGVIMNWQPEAKRLPPAERDFVGRTDELEALNTLLAPHGPTVLHVYGLAGMGKSRLLNVFAERARVAGVALVRLDCRAMEPTAAGFLQSLSASMGGVARDIESAAARLNGLGPKVILVLDTYEVYRLMDTWLRQVLVPALPDNVGLLCLGRERPAAAWHGTSPTGRHLVRTLALGPLSHEEALRLLRLWGVADRSAERIAHVAHGHPLALRLAASACAERPELPFGEVSLQQALEELTRMFLADVRDPVTRHALEACALVRRVTVSVLGAMLPDLAPGDAFDRLKFLPFVEMAEDGLVIHESVREAISRTLRARDPCRLLGYQRAAWRQLQKEIHSAGRGELWRYTADILYLIENPVVREAFFPEGGRSAVVEPATSEDAAGIRSIVQAWEAAPGHLLSWWKRRPDTFVVVRGGDDRLLGFCCRFVSDEVEQNWMDEDPVTAEWSRHLAQSPLPDGQKALFCRRWLAADSGEAPSEVQAAVWLDLKRTYMERRPALRRVYLTVEDLPAYAPVAMRLGFCLLEGREQVLNGHAYHSVVLDFGPGSVDGWLAALAAEELGIEHPSLLDVDARELVLDGDRISLTPLEFGVMKYLSEHEGKAVARQELLRHVWDTRYYGGSNVVDTVVRSLRRKLGERSRQVETVTGVGYRFRPHGGQ